MESPEKARKKPKARCMNFSPIDMFGSPVEFNIRGEDTYKTFFGCFWSFLMVGTMIAAIVYYFIIYLDTTNVNMSSQLLQASEPPAMNLKQNGLFFSLAFNKGNKMLKESEVIKYFSISANLFEYTQTSTTATDGSADKQMNEKPTVTKIVFKPCKSAGITGKVQGKTIKGKTSIALSDFGYCSDIFDNSNRFLMQGDDDSDYYAYIEIKIFPCLGTYPTITAPAPPPPGGTTAPPSGPSGGSGVLTVGSADGKVCLLPNLGGSPGIKNEEVQYIRQTLRDVTVGVTLIDSVVEGANFEDPIAYLMNGNYMYAPSATQEKRVTFIFKTIKVMTDRGIIAEDFKSEETYSIDGTVFDIKDRDPNDKIKFFSPEGETYQPIPYLTLKFLSGNSRQEYTRKYIKILDIFGLVGGITEVLSFIIAILYSWYNGIRMEQDIINYTILHLDPDDETVEQWEKSRELTFWNVFKFHYFTCCVKKDPKFKVFEASQHQVGQQTSVGHMIDSINYVEVMKKALLNTAQRRAMRFADLYDDDLSDSESTKGESENKLNATDSVHILRSSKNKNEIEDRVNKFLLNNLPGPLSHVGADHSQQPSIGSKYNLYLNDDDRPIIQKGSEKSSPTHANPNQVSPAMNPKPKKHKLPYKL